MRYGRPFFPDRRLSIWPFCGCLAPSLVARCCVGTPVSAFGRSGHTPEKAHGRNTAAKAFSFCKHLVQVVLFHPRQQGRSGKPQKA